MRHGIMDSGHILAVHRQVTTGIVTGPATTTMDAIAMSKKKSHPDMTSWLMSICGKNAPYDADAQFAQWISRGGDVSTRLGDHGLSIGHACIDTASEDMMLMWLKAGGSSHMRCNAGRTVIEHGMHAAACKHNEQNVFLSMIDDSDQKDQVQYNMSADEAGDEVSSHLSMIASCIAYGGNIIEHWDIWSSYDELRDRLIHELVIGGKDSPCMCVSSVAIHLYQNRSLNASRISQALKKPCRDPMAMALAKDIMTSFARKDPSMMTTWITALPSSS
jgi:hypothetical protein